MKYLSIIGIHIAVSLMLSSCAEKKGENMTQEYSVIEVTTKPTKITETYSASIRGRQDVDIYPQIEGKITKISITEGQNVKKGQTMFILDQIPYQASLRTAIANVHSAEAQVATARLDVRSKEELFKENVISEYDLTTARNTLAMALASLEQAKAAQISAQNNLSYTEIKSPADGTVGILPYKIGALVSPSIPQPLTSVSDNNEVYVYFSMTENQLRDKVRQFGSLDKAIAQMPEITLVLNDGSVYNHPGRIETVSGIINEQTGTLQLRGSFPNPEKLLWSGGTGNIQISNTNDESIVIPQNATIELQDKIMVYKVVNGKATATFINVHPVNNGNDYIVTDGLNTGDLIVGEGVGLIRDGQAINIKK